MEESISDETDFILHLLNDALSRVDRVLHRWELHDVNQNLRWFFIHFDESIFDGFDSKKKKA